MVSNARGRRPGTGHAGRRVLLMTCLSLGQTLQNAVAGGFDRAIEVATQRVVKLYGQGAGMQEGYGTGVIVSSDGLVVTVSSLLIGAPNILAVGHDGGRYAAELIHRDHQRQLALLRLKAPLRDQAQSHPDDSDAKDSSDPLGPFPYFDLSIDASLHPGAWVVAAGNAFKVADGAETVSIAHGVFSTTTRLDARRRVRDFPYHGECLVVDAITSNPGAPGSAMVNIDGEFVGMTGRVVLSNLTHTHLNYAIPRSVLQQFVYDALNPPSDGPDGVAAAEIDAVDLGIKLARTGYRTVLPFVDRVRQGSPADQAGIRRDDLILSLNGRSIDSVRAYDAKVESLRSGDAVKLVVRRGRRIIEVELNTETQP